MYLFFCYTVSMLEPFQSAILGGGCFWCLEAVFKLVKGVSHVQSGYTGGHVQHPSYDDICTGETGHAEVVRIEFDSAVITFDELLDIFWKIHDPTTMNRQGNDRGTQYRSAIFFIDENQKKAAVESRVSAERKKIWPNPIVTEIVPLDIFYPAEDYHDNYYERNRMANPYCIYVIDPKVKKMQEHFKQQLK